jgi:predicted NAD/FAD-binding protein
MKTVGIVGSGIAGLGCAYLLRNDYAVTIFDGNGYAGGHTNTIDVKSAAGADVAFDTGFMVFNHQTYPLLTALFAELGVITKKTDMSFSVQDLSSGIQWNGAGLDKIFAQRKNLVNLRFLSMLRELDWFNKNAYSHLAQPDNVGLTVREYIKKYKLSADFLNLYMVPMGSSVWSTETRAMLDFPAASLIRFFYNHGFRARYSLSVVHRGWWRQAVCA